MDLQNKSDLGAYLDSHEGSRLKPLLADLNLQQDMVDEAVELCQKMITEDPRSPYGYYLLALVDIKSGEIENAIEYLKQTVDLDNGYLDAYYLLIEIGREKLSPGILKACYEKIHFLNPFDDNAATESGRISQEADYEGLRNIQLPEIKIHKTVSRIPVEEKAEAVEPDTDETSVPEPDLTAEPLTEEDMIAAEPEIEPDVKAEPVREQPILTEEEAHLGPMIPYEEKPEVQLDTEPDNIEFAEPESALSETAAPENEPVPEPEPEPEPPRPESHPTETKPDVPPPPQGTPSSALNDMFAKLKSKPLDEVQKENWTLPVVEAPAPPPNPNELLQKPNVKFTVPLKDKEDPQKKIEEIQKEIGLTGIQREDEKKKETAEPLDQKSIPASDEEEGSKPQATSPKPPKPKTNGNKVELKIPVPTFTLVEVFKKQKLYDEALQLLDVLEKKSKNPERIEKERTKILKMKMEEE